MKKYLKLIESCKKGNYEMAVKALKYTLFLGRANPNICYDGNPVLINVCKNGFFEIAELLLQKGANVNIENAFKETPLFIACMIGHKGLVELLLKNSADTIIRTKDGVDPLMISFEKNDVETMDLLLHYGADINIKYGNDSLLSIACDKRDFKMVEYLLKKIEIRYETINRPLKISFNNGDLEIFELLLKSVTSVGTRMMIDDDINSLLMNLYSKRDYNKFDYLLGHGSNPNIKINNNTILIDAIKKEDVKMVEILVKHGAEIEFQHKERWTSYYGSMAADITFPNALITAVLIGNTEIVNILIKAGANVNVKCFPEKDREKYLKGSTGFEVAPWTLDIEKTALKYAYESGHSDIVKLLKENGAIEK